MCSIWQYAQSLGTLSEDGKHADASPNIRCKNIYASIIGLLKIYRYFCVFLTHYPGLAEVKMLNIRVDIVGAIEF